MYRCFQSERQARWNVSSSDCKFLPEFRTLFCDRQPFTHGGAARLCLCTAFHCEYRPHCSWSDSRCLTDCESIGWEILHGSNSIFDPRSQYCKFLQLLNNRFLYRTAREFILSMTLVLLQRVQENESNAILFDIVNLCTSQGQWIIREE